MASRHSISITTPQELAGWIERYIYEASDEARRVWLGLKETSESAAIQQRYEALFTPEVIATARSFERRAEGRNLEEAERLRMVIEEGLLANETAPLEDTLATDLLQRTVSVAGKTVSYFGLQPAWSRENDYAVRDQLYDAFLGINAETNELRKECIEAVERGIRTELGAADYVSWMEQRKRFVYRPFLDALKAAEPNLRRSYEPTMDRRVAARLEVPFGTARASHAGYLVRGVSEFDSHFPPKQLRSALLKTLAALGIDLEQMSNITLDTEDRPKKNPRAVCFPLRVPDEIYLVIKPTGGIHDYEAFFHEAGHALHFGFTDAALPYAFRVLSRSYALTEIFSYLLEHLIYDPAWLEWGMGMSAEMATHVAAELRNSNLFQLLRYIAKLEFELGFYAAPTEWAHNAQRYSKLLTDATGFIYPQENYLDDFDSGLYSADYLRAWVTEAQFYEHLASEFGRQWFATPAAGDYLKSLWHEGTTIENEDVAVRIGATPHDTAALERFYEELA